MGAACASSLQYTEQTLVGWQSRCNKNGRHRGPGRRDMLLLVGYQICQVSTDLNGDTLAEFIGDKCQLNIEVEKSYWFYDRKLSLGLLLGGTAIQHNTIGLQ